MSSTEPAARSMWRLCEPVFVAPFFMPEGMAGFAEAGLRGYWRGYFASRAAPLGQAGPEVVTSSFFTFAPAFVARSIPAIWDTVPPGEAVRIRLAAASALLRRLLAGREAEVAVAAGLLWEAVRELEFSGRVLSAANAALPVPGDDFGRLWQAANVLREHRGDGHFAALTAAGIDGCESLVLRCAMDLNRESVQPLRGWTDDQWRAAEARLTARGWLAAGGTGPGLVLTAAGRGGHAAAEAATDLAASRPWDRLGTGHRTALAEVLAPLARLCADSLPPVAGQVGLPSPRPSR